MPFPSRHDRYHRIAGGLLTFWAGPDRPQHQRRCHVRIRLRRWCHALKACCSSPTPGLGGGRSSMTSRARTTGWYWPESGVATVGSSLPTCLWSRQGRIRLAQADSACWGFAPTGAAHRWVHRVCSCAGWLAWTRSAWPGRPAGRRDSPGADTVRIWLDRHRHSTLVRDRTADEEQGAASSFDRFRVLCTAEPARHHRCWSSTGRCGAPTCSTSSGGEPGNFRRAHYHPSFAYTGPTDRAWDPRLTSDLMSWIVDRLQNLAGTVDDQAKADLDVDCDQPAMLRDLEQIARVISLRLGQACPSPQACSSQTSDVRYVVPPMFAQYRSVPHGLDPREDASSWADVVTRRDPPAHRTLIPESVYPSARLVISVPTSWPRS